MNVLHFVCDGRPGGGTNHVLQLLQAFNDLDDLALLTQEGSYLAGKASEFDLSLYSGDFFQRRIDRRSVETLKDAVIERKPDIVHCHGGRAAFYAAFLKFDIPIVYTVHGFHFPQKSLAYRIFGFLGELLCFRAASHIIFVSNFDESIANRYKLTRSKRNCSVVHNGIQKPATVRFGEKKSSKVGFIGRLVEQKNPLLFLDVLSEIPNVECEIVGGGVLYDSMLSHIKKLDMLERVTMAGELDHCSTLERLKSMSILVVTSRWEGLPLLPLEAMHLGVPIVSTPVGGIPEVIEHGVNGFLADDVQAIAKYTRLLIDDASLRKRIVSNAKKDVASRFSEEVMLSKTRDVYEKVIFR